MSNYKNSSKWLNIRVFTMLFTMLIFDIDSSNFGLRVDVLTHIFTNETLANLENIPPPL